MNPEALEKQLKQEREVLEKKLASERVVRGELPKGVVWAKPLGPGKRPKTHSQRKGEPIETVASRFVNLRVTGKTPTVLNIQEVRKFREQHKDRLHFSPGLLAKLSLQLRLAWQPKRAEYLGRVLETIFCSSTTKPVELTDRSPANARRPAFQILPGHTHPEFKPRDLLDEMAYAIWQASERGLLKVCKGHGCKTLLFIANRKRRAYCYEGCGNDAKMRAKREWWRRNRPPKRRKRPAR